VNHLTRFLIEGDLTEGQFGLMLLLVLGPGFARGVPEGDRLVVVVGTGELEQKSDYFTAAANVEVDKSRFLNRHDDCSLGEVEYLIVGSCWTDIDGRRGELMKLYTRGFRR